MNKIILAALLLILAGCAGTMSDEAEYARADDRAQAADLYIVLANACASTGGVLTMPRKGATRTPSSRHLTLEDLRGARCK